MTEPLIPKASTILMTGVNSFIASHVADQLLADGYNVRGTVRSISKGEKLQQHFDASYGRGRFEVAVVEDIALSGAFDEVVKGTSVKSPSLIGLTILSRTGVAGICHVATPATLTTDPNEAIPRTVSGAVNIFKSSAKEPSIRSVVYTSDSWAVAFPAPNRAVQLTISDYNEYAIEAAHNVEELETIQTRAWDPSVSVELVVWAAAKVTAEKAIWQFVSDHQPSFQVSSVIPHMNFGPSVGGLPPSSTGRSIPDLLSNQQKPDLYFPAQHFVNVRDCAKLHVAALLDPAQAGKRIFACAAPFNWNDILQILRGARPNATIREDFPDLGRDLNELPRVSAEMLLWKWYGHGWTALYETVQQNIAGL